MRVAPSENQTSRLKVTSAGVRGVGELPRHFDRSRTPLSLTFYSFFRLQGYLRSWFQLWQNWLNLTSVFFSIASGTSEGVAWRQNRDIYSEKKSKSMMWLNAQWTRGLNSGHWIRDLEWPWSHDLDLFLWPHVTPGTLLISDIHLSKYLPISTVACQ